MNYTLDITDEESEFIFDAVCNFAWNIRNTPSSTGLIDEDLIQSVIDKVAAMDEEISSHYYFLDKD